MISAFLLHREPQLPPEVFTVMELLVRVGRN